MSAYLSLESLKDALGHKSNDATRDSDLLRIISVCSGKIDRYCGRTFGSETATQTFDAPAGELLITPDLIGLPSVVTAYGVTLALITDYVVVPAPGFNAEMGLRRMLADDPIAWDALAPEDTNPFNAVVVTGTWNLPVPDEITQACEILACRLWAMRKIQYSGEAGGDVMGRVTGPDQLITPTAADLLAPYVRGRVATIYGAST